MLYYTGKPTDLIESSTTISIYLEKLPWDFVFFPKNAIKLTSPKQQILSVYSFKRSWLFRHNLQKHKANLRMPFLDISWQLIEMSNEMSRRDEKKTKNTCKKTNLTFIKPEVDVSCCITSFSRSIDVRVLFSKTVWCCFLVFHPFLDVLVFAKHFRRQSKTRKSQAMLTTIARNHGHD